MSKAEEICRILSLARSQLGVTETAPGRVPYNTEYYGKEVTGSWYPWCCAFQWWLFSHSGLSQLFYGGGKTASCTQLYQFYRKQGQLVEKTALEPGDLVFFVFDGGKSGGMNHIGICESVRPGFVTTIDGNTGTDEANGGTVARKTRSLQWVSCGARPRYEEVESMKIYEYLSEVPDWATPSVSKALQNGYIKMDSTGAMHLNEVNLQPLVWLDRAGLLEAPAREGV